jgi:drug/metabolite transporter (DMT)-like permease
MSKTMPDNRRATMIAYAALVLVMLLWAGNTVIARAVRDAVPPFTLALLRWIGAWAIVTPFAWQHLRSDRAALARGKWRVLMLGLLGVAAFNAFLYSGVRYTTASNAMLLQAAIPTLVLVADYLIFRDAPRPLRLIGVALSTLGVITVVLQGNLLALSSVTFNHGDLLVLCGVVAWALYTALLRLRPAIHPLSFLSVTFAIGAMAMAPLAAHEWQLGQGIAWSPPTIGAILYVAVLPSVVAYLLFNMAVAKLGPAAAGQAITLMPLFGALLAVVALGEALHDYHLWGMGLILIGILVPLAELFRRDPQPVD